MAGTDRAQPSNSGAGGGQVLRAAMLPNFSSAVL